MHMQWHSIHNRKHTSSVPRPKSQSAMEYLMTYGWAILIIAVVLGALYSLGVFNGISFAPKASAGSCQVFRPSGPGTAMNINLEGECQGLMPQYVAQYAGASTSCTNTGFVPISINNIGVSTMSALTMSWWINPVVGGVNIHLLTTNLNPGGDGVYCSSSGCTLPDVEIFPPSSSAVGTWSFLTLVLNSSGTATMYLNGKPGTSGSWNGPLTGVTSLNLLGYTPTCSDITQGSMANVQIYNASFDANQVAALYLDGIGGAPITIQNLVGWWPLNGNANDYSGNNNNGQATNVIYTGSWTNEYSAP